MIPLEGLIEFWDSAADDVVSIVNEVPDFFTDIFLLSDDDIVNNTHIASDQIPSNHRDLSKLRRSHVSRDGESLLDYSQRMSSSLVRDSVHRSQSSEKSRKPAHSGVQLEQVSCDFDDIAFHQVTVSFADLDIEEYSCKILLAVAFVGFLGLFLPGYADFK